MFLSNNFEIELVVRFPVLSQIIFGGVPFTKLRSTKSESNVTIEKKLFFANSKITESVAFSRPNSTTYFDPED